MLDWSTINSLQVVVPCAYLQLLLSSAFPFSIHSSLFTSNLPPPYQRAQAVLPPVSLHLTSWFQQLSMLKGRSAIGLPALISHCEYSSNNTSNSSSSIIGNQSSWALIGLRYHLVFFSGTLFLFLSHHCCASQPLVVPLIAVQQFGLPSPVQQPPTASAIASNIPPKQHF